MGAYGGSSPKATTLMGTVPWLHRLHKKMEHGERMSLRQDSTKQVTVKYTDSKGEARVSGGKDLKATQAYPVGFGAMLGLYTREREEATGSPESPRCRKLKLESSGDSEPEGYDSDTDCFDDLKAMWAKPAGACNLGPGGLGES